MQIIVNGQTREVPDQVTVAELIRHLGLAGTACAAELNEALVPRRNQETTRLAPGDRVELVTLVGGG